MKNYRITVNSVVYDVTVEETSGTEVSKNAVLQPVPAVNKAETNTEVKKPDLSGKAIKAQVPGKITNILVKEGQSVKSGDTIVMLEAMKMEIPVVSSETGVVSSILVSVGQNVENGDNLVLL